jgi:hypothetical protein
MIFAIESDGFVQQDVGARLDYAEDWTEFMALAPSDTIQASNWTSVPNGLIFEDSQIDGAIVSTFVRGGTAGLVYRVQNIISTAQGRTDVRSFILLVQDSAVAPDVVLKTALFDRFNSIADFKKSSLAFLDDSFPVDNLTDSVVWDNMVAAEAEASHQLRVFFQPTVVLPDSSKQDERDVLVAAGTPYVVEDDYDFDPGHWDSTAWGFLQLRQTPVRSIESMRLSYPSPTNQILAVPPEWLQVDYKYGQIRVVPAGSVMGLGQMSSFLMSTFSAGRLLPGALQVRYTAGLDKKDYPDLVNLVKRMAVLRILKNALLPQSSSISADGLSQSSSIDMVKWQEGIDKDLGDLRDQIKGIRLGVL